MTSDPAAGGGFLSRWSRRKGASARTVAPEAPQAATPPADVAPAEVPELPPIDELGASSDYRAFLQKSVTAAVQAQALHKAWTSDAAIASFRGMADYDWDFNATGYGRLWAADNVPKLLEAVLGPVDPTPAAETPSAEAPPTERPDPPSVRQSAPEPAVASVPDPEPEQPIDSPPSRRHGRAIPV